jgi:transcription elongation factor SPT5
MIMMNIDNPFCFSRVNRLLSTLIFITVKKNEWVRMTRGHYKGDLALVLDVRESGLKCIVQVVPRLDLALLDLPPEQARIRRRVKPPQKFFNQQEVASMGRQVMRQYFRALDKNCDFFENNYYHDGYMLKEVTVGSMIKPCTEDDPPSLDELQSFRKRTNNKDEREDDDDENEGSKMAASLLDELSDLQGKTGLGKAASSSSGGLLIGDTVEVIEGDLVGMRGKLMSMDENTVKVKPNDAALDIGGSGEIEFLASQVRKFIAVGHHVKVMDGRYANETGTVVAVEKLDGETDFTAVVLTDATRKEISGTCS